PLASCREEKLSLAICKIAKRERARREKRSYLLTARRARALNTFSLARKVIAEEQRRITERCAVAIKPVRPDKAGWTLTFADDGNGAGTIGGRTYVRPSNGQ